MKKIYLILTIIIFATQIFAQNYTISGYLKDSQSGEVLIGANVFDLHSQKGTVTNSYGFYSITLPRDSVNLFFSYIGYDSQNLKMLLSANQQIEIKMIAGNVLDEITVNAEQIKRQNDIGIVEISSKTVKLLPSMAGESDILKALQLMPGIQSAGEGSSQLVVRGGSPDQNLILLDDVPMYYASHLGGFISVFNPYSIKNVKLIKGGFPAQYGGRLSSVIDIRMKDGNMTKTAGEVELGILSSKISLEGPIIKNKLSYILSVRKGMIDLYAMALRPIMQIKQKAGYSFWDTNLKFNYVVSNKSRIYLSMYSGFDKIFIYLNETTPDYASKNQFNVKWGNTIAALRWNYKFSDKIFSNTTLAYSNYGYFNQVYSDYTDLTDSLKVRQLQSGKFQSKITDYTFKTDFDYNLNSWNNIKFGTNAIYHQFEPGIISLKASNSLNEKQDTVYSDFAINTQELVFYVSDKIKIGKKLVSEIGVHSSAYLVDSKKYYSLEPRILLNYKVNNNLNIKSSYTKMRQYLHLLSNSGTGTPADLWVPPTSKIPPQDATQFTFGFSSILTKHKIEFSVEGFYKDLKNLIEIKEGTSLLWSTGDWQQKVDIGGRGKVYGLEFLLQKTTGKTTGWISYTLSKNIRQFANQNLGRTYFYNYDHTHDLNIVAVWSASKNITLSASWSFATGNAISLAQGEYEILTYIEDFNKRYQKYYFTNILIYNEKNSFRMPATHHLDISANFAKQKKHGLRTWSLSVYNVYNQMNAYMIYYNYTYKKGVYQIQLKKITLFPIIPSISYSFKF